MLLDGRYGSLQRLASGRHHPQRALHKGRPSCWLASFDRYLGANITPINTWIQSLLILTGLAAFLSTLTFNISGSDQIRIHPQATIEARDFRKLDIDIEAE